MIRRVARRRDRPENEPVAQHNFFAVLDVAVRDFQTGAGRREERGTPGFEFGTARDVVGVRMRVGRPADHDALRLRDVELRGRQARRIDDERSAVAEIDEVARMTEALVDERRDPLGRPHADFVAETRTQPSVSMTRS